MSSFDLLVNETAKILKDVPRCVMGVSGVDSFVVFMVCARAYALLGRPGSIAGVHFYDEEIAILSELEWLEKEAQAPVFTKADYAPWQDGHRWGALLDYATYTEDGRYRRGDDACWVVGSRNKTERMLGSYSNGSRLASFEPLYHVWRSEVHMIAKELRMPKSLLLRSCVAHCGCGDPTADILALDVIGVDTALQQIEVHGFCGDSPVARAVMKQRSAGVFKAELPVKLPGQTNVINVNPAIIESNKKGKMFLPTLRARRGHDGQHPLCAYGLKIQGPCEIHYRPEQPLECGAHVWIETSAEIIKTEKKTLDSNEPV